MIMCYFNDGVIIPATKLPVPQQDTGSFHINKDKFLILIRLNFLHINHQIQILINVNIPVAAVK